MALLHTPLYEKHVELGGKMVDFAGFELPVQYPTGIIAEHMAVRTKAGLFDVSHMGEFLLTGPESRKQLNLWLTNSYTKLKPNRVRYSVLCQDDGGALDDLLVYCFDDEKFWIIPNAANTDADFAWLTDHLTCDVKLENISRQIGQIALQGPATQAIITKLVPEDQLPEKYYSFNEHVTVAGVDCLVSQTGYTGEFGYELYIPADGTPAVWDALLEAGKEEGLAPAGLGARDTLRMEAAMPLYGQEMTPEITPLEAGLDFGVKLNKEEDWIGKKAMAASLPLKRTRIGFEVTGKGIVREHMPIFDGEKEIGFTTTGNKAPYLGKAIGMGYVPVEYAEVGRTLQVHVRNKVVDVQIVEMPFYKREK
ncbi:MAG: glycine cleavage system aminomethyltransferase GcvT [Actinomycetaceae bacterium]|nr:glycine cleavage system aminomethyltransferase GcvT [Actinomycetaceae bacterium]MDY6082735.1 glycine cleavage system aminomethyltransferase GcvT [Actinomycetaceae bacterium]